MKKRNPIERSKYIESRYKEYLRSSFEFGSARLQRLFDKQLDGETLFKGPYVDLNLPFRRGENLNSLINEGVLCKSFRTLGDTNFERPLYSHQEEAIRRIGAGRSAIVTTGTGSGKTECFLYPIFNEILQDLEKGNSEAGIRAIFLYPMNALVNDQIDRLRKILSTCPDITFGFFTGDTKETVARNYREKYFEEYEIHIPKNELVSREEIRKNPPHLLFTNYSMLEYLLIRPNDYAIFEPSRLQNWKFVVLDEAHSYSGSLGIELSLLIRRLTGLAPKKPRFILTSATLGEQGKSESKIVEFARNLTSANFEIEDIIFSKRIPLNPVKLMYSVAGPDYTALKAAIKDIEQIKKIASKYKKVTGSDASQCLYELLESDYNVYEIYKFLKGGCKSFAKLYDNIAANIAQNELIYLIDLINQAEKDGIGLFDLKYHSFVRPLSGAYITLGKDQKLSLTKTNHIEGQKAFEIGNCRLWIILYYWKIQHNNIDNLDYLLQNNEVDIYENYGDNKYVSLDYFLLENTVNEDEIDLAVLEEHKVCSKCGSIYPAANLNAVKCKCDDSYLCSVYRVCLTIESGDEVAFNNINQCPCCAHRSRSGVVKSLNLGKDEGTALIAQILYEVIDEGKVAKKKTEKLSLTRKGNNSSTEETAKVKQFLAFSDSRQQASFAAVFLDANYVRMMQKRLIWKVVEDSGYREIPVDEMVSRLTSIIKEESLFSSDLSAHKKAWITVLYDLLKVDGAYDGEGLGLYYFDLDIKDIMSQIDEIEVKEAYGQYGITKADLETIMQVVFGVFKVTPAISYVKSTLTPEEKLQALEYRRFDNYVMFHSPKSTQGIRSFLPVRNGSNIVVRYIQKVFGCSNEMAKTVLNVLFNNLAVEGGLLKKHASKEAYQIDASKYIIKNYMNTEYYRCTKCGRLTPYNVHNICVQDKCDGTLVAVDPDEVLSTNYYRNQYKSMKIESVVIKEHTAQLDRKKAKQYQKDFKNKKINILSCSTTFEMGIDIGGLETVFMRNVPPSPANYVQRAGRAGRRKESSAYILTYCGTGSHDYTYFCEPEKMISGIINPPYFNVINKKIIIRHLMAACLGFFFRENPGYFENISSLVFNNGINAFKKYIESHPTKLNEYINNKVLPENTSREYHNFKWFDDMKGKDENWNISKKRSEPFTMSFKWRNRLQ